MPIDPYKRYQKDFKLHEMYPNPPDGTCSCGCGVKLTGRRKRWATDDCVKPLLTDYWIIKGDVQTIRNELSKIDRYKCRNCGIQTKWDEWHADHIVEVVNGGGGRGIENYQTLCIPCHKIKTKSLFKERKNRP
ncbi:hypothetical protein LCGC14_0371020 [marine sediment metagenome]|uniref:HNH nuclease domain-containing protein n=1 Tax=marine sediment metagenome TaxID=412755 RepID=A0A0F9VSI2_9ZZZZ|nr:HNH endonuclease [Maribacter sp.]HDZ04860.1 HNH endonuclease [Maribacter sp.]